MPDEQLGDERLNIRRAWRLGTHDRGRASRRGGAQSRAAQPPLLQLAERFHQEREQEFDDRHA
jgi:hypothetical protein